MKILNWKNGLYSIVWENIPFVIAGDESVLQCVLMLHKGYKDEQILEYLLNTCGLDSKEATLGIKQIRDAVNFADNYICEEETEVPSMQSIFTLNLTRKCNLNCKHCYAGGTTAEEEMSLQEIESVIEFMGNRMVQPRLMVITGGEPTLEKEKLKRAILKGEQYHFNIRVNTNGILIDKDLAIFFKAHNVVVQLSLDGIDKETHALLRNNESSYNYVIDAIQLLNNYSVRYYLSFTVHSRNVEQIPKMIDFAMENKAEKFNTSSLVKIGNAKLNELNTVEYSEEFKILFDAVKNDKAKQHLTRSTLFAETVIAIRAGIKFTQCGTGNCTSCVDANGEIYPCLNMMYPQYLIANVKRENLQKQYDSNSILEMFKKINIDSINAKCSSCFFRYWCGGFCRGETIANGGLLTDPYVRCASWKKGLLFILKCLAEYPDLYENEGLYE